MAELTDDERDRENRQDEVLASSELLKLRLLTHTAQLELFVTALRSRTPHGDGYRDGAATEDARDGRVD